MRQYLKDLPLSFGQEDRPWDRSLKLSFVTKIWLCNILSHKFMKENNCPLNLELEDFILKNLRRENSIIKNLGQEILPQNFWDFFVKKTCTSVNFVTFTIQLNIA